MSSFPRVNTAGLPRAASRHNPGSVSPAALRIAQEADATMSPSGWETEYAAPKLRAAVPAPAPNPISAPARRLPTA